MMNALSILACFSFLILKPSFAFASSDSIGEPHVAWTKNKIRVCWLERPAPLHFGESERQAVQKIIEREYTLARTGITFIGWNSCSAETVKHYDAVLVQSTQNLGGVFNVYGQASIGEAGIIRKEQASFFGLKLGPERTFIDIRGGTVPYIYMRIEPQEVEHFAVTAIENLQMTALHEFGHLAGLRHEQARPEAKEQENESCLSDETESASTKRYGAYDPNSVMNYCWLETLHKFGTSFVYVKPGFESATQLESVGIWNSMPTMSSMPKVTDLSLIRIQPTLHSNALKVSLKIGLSQGDLKALKSMYRHLSSSQP